MTIADLKLLIQDLPDEMEVVIPLNAGDGFDGMFFSPCIMESGEAELGLTEEGDEHEESFVLVPCGFFEPSEHPDPTLN